MILRVFRARAAASDRDRLLAHLRDRIYPANVGTEGLRTFQAGIRDHDDGSVELALVSTWADFGAMSDSVGADLLRPAWLAEIQDRLEPLRADHYELVGEELHGIVPLAGGALRVFTGLLAERGGESFFEFARHAQTAQLDSGVIIASHIGRRMDERGEEAAFVAVWRDADSPRAMGGAPDAPANRDAWGSYFSSWSFAAYDAIARVPGTPRAGAALLLADDERRYVFATPAAGELLGRPPARILGRRLEDLASPSDRDRIHGLWQGFVEAGGGTAELEIERPDGTTVPVRYEARAHTPWRGVHASVLAAGGAGVDVDAALATAGLVARYDVREAELPGGAA